MYFVPYLNGLVWIRRFPRKTKPWLLNAQLVRDKTVMTIYNRVGNDFMEHIIIHNPHRIISDACALSENCCRPGVSFMTIIFPPGLIIYQQGNASYDMGRIIRKRGTSSKFHVVFAAIFTSHESNRKFMALHRNPISCWRVISSQCAKLQYQLVSVWHEIPQITYKNLIELILSQVLAVLRKKDSPTSF